MDVIATAINAAAVAAIGVLLAWFLKGRFEAIDERFDSFERRIDLVEERLGRRMDAMQSSIDALRSDLTQVALAVGVRPRATNG